MPVVRWRSWLSFAGGIFKRRPMLSNVLSFGALYVSAEATQQFIDSRFRQSSADEEPKEFRLNWEALGRYAIIGTAAIGPGLYVWFRALDRWIPSRAPRMVAAKVVTDQLVSSPACLAVFFVGMNLLERKKDVFEELKKKFWSTYMVSCCFWPTVQAINFGLLPPHTRVVFVGTASFVWCNVLCLVKRRPSTSTESNS